MIEPLQLFISVVIHKVDHILVNIREAWFCPLQSFHINKSIQIINTKAQINSIARSNLNFILGNPGHAVRNMDPCSSWLCSRFDNVKPICVMIYDFFTFAVVFLSSLRAKNDWISPRISTPRHEVCVTLRVLHLVPIHVFKFERLASVLHQLKTIRPQLNFQNSVNSKSLLISKFCRWKNKFCFNQF